MTFRGVYEVLKDSAMKFWDDKAPQLGAALAFYTALALSPLILMVTAIAGLAFGPEAARGEVAHQIEGMVGGENAEMIQSMLSKAASPTANTIAGIVGLVTLIFSASGVFAQLQDALNTIWKVEGKKPAEGFGIWSMVRDRLLSFSMVCGMAFLLLVSLVISAVLNAAGGVINGWLPDWATPVMVVNAVLSFALIAAMFAMIYKWLPEIRLAWKDVWVGAGVTALLFGLGKYLIGLYLGKAAVGSAYGAAGAFVVLLLWIYYSTQILLFGAELTFVYATRYGSGVRDADGKPLPVPTPDGAKKADAAKPAGAPAIA